MRLLATSAAATFSSFCRPFSLTLDSKPNSHVLLATTLSRHRFPRGQLFLLIISSLMRSIYARSACISDGQYLSGHISSSAPIISDLCACQRAILSRPVVRLQTSFDLSEETSNKQQELDSADRTAGHRGVHLQPP